MQNGKLILVLTLLATLFSCSTPEDQYVTVQHRRSGSTRVVKVSEVDWCIYRDTYAVVDDFSIVASPVDAAKVQQYLISVVPTQQVESLLKQFVSTNYDGKLILHCRLSSGSRGSFKFQFVWCTDGVTTDKEQHGIVNAHLEVFANRWNCWSGFCYYNDPVGWRGTSESPVSGIREWFDFDNTQLVGMIELPMYRLREAIRLELLQKEAVNYATGTLFDRNSYPRYKVDSELTPDWVKLRDHLCFDQGDFESTSDLFMPPIGDDDVQGTTIF